MFLSVSTVSALVFLVQCRIDPLKPLRTRYNLQAVPVPREDIFSPGSLCSFSSQVLQNCSPLEQWCGSLQMLSTAYSHLSPVTCFY